jgi:hypothetical protein
MAQITYRANLSSRSFPFLTDFQGRTVIVPGPDNTFNRTVASDVDLDKDAGIPTAFYMHNVIPASYGFSSVGYENIIPALSPASIVFSDAKLLRSNVLVSGNGPRFYFAPSALGTHYTYTLGTDSWAPIITSVPYAVDAQLTYATLQGISYIFFPGTGCYKWDSVLNTLIPVDLLGLTPANITGISTYQGYLIAYDTDTVYWSSTLDIDPSLNEIDFVPSLSSGAGSISPEGAKGPITVILPATFGLAIYTTSNIVSAVYSGNSRYPFNFKEVVSSGGCSSTDLVTYDANTGNQYAYTTSGFQIVTATATQTVFPELTDFLAGAEFEDFDEVSLTLSKQTLTSPMTKRIVSVADRYLIISYGITTLTHAIVYDMTQRRYGKLKVDHVDCFEFEYLDPALADAPRKSIAFLKSDGSVSLVNTSVTFADSEGVIILGKFQYVRSRLLNLDAVEFQSVHAGQSAYCYSFSSMSGGTFESCRKVQGWDATENDETQRIFNFDEPGVNHSILIQGGFFLSSLVLVFHPLGGS